MKSIVMLSQGGQGIPWQGDDGWDDDYGGGGGDGSAFCCMFAVIAFFSWLGHLAQKNNVTSDGPPEWKGKPEKDWDDDFL